MGRQFRDVKDGVCSSAKPGLDLGPPRPPQEEARDKERERPRVCIATAPAVTLLRPPAALCTPPASRRHVTPPRGPLARACPRAEGHVWELTILPPALTPDG